LATEDKPEKDEKPTEKKPSLTKTPMYSAMNAARYARQELIKAINAEEKTQLICYTAGEDTEINRGDVIGFVEMLHNIAQNTPIDLMLTTGGGDVDACEKLVKLIAAKKLDQPLRVIVPNLAKSAGTLMLLGADRIIMSDSSEIGMIDPQFRLGDGRGNDLWYSVTEYLHALEEHTEALRKNKDDPVALLMLDSFDARTVKKFQGIRDRVRVFAEGQLKRQGAKSSTISHILMSSAKWKTHGHPIDHADAKEIGLPVDYVPSHEPRWQRYWNLYCLQDLETKPNKKLFESAYASQLVEESA